MIGWERKCDAWQLARLRDACIAVIDANTGLVYPSEARVLLARFNAEIARRIPQP